MHKHPADKPYILKSLIACLCLFIVLTTLFSLKLHGILLVVSIFLSLFFSGYCLHVLIRHIANKQNSIYLSQFHPLPDIATYQEAIECAYTPEKKYKNFVLLLHGFTASPHEVRQLILELEKQNIPYIAPMLNGFGLMDAHLLERVKPEDFFRLALIKYDFLTQIAESVTIIGHSMGAVLATYVAQQRQVHRLILTAPALYFFPGDKILTTLLTTPILSQLFIALIPYLPKSLKKSSKESPQTKGIGHTRFQYLSIPSFAVRSMLITKQKVDITKIHPTDLHIFYGEKDRVVNVDRCLAALKDGNFTFNAQQIPKATHNLFEDEYKLTTTQRVIESLQ